jgi:CheY-like chemotaxis protein
VGYSVLAQSNESQAVEQRQCLLLVEDDPAIADLLTAIVEDAGCSAVQAADGLSALRLAHELHPCLITLDLGLPALDGRSVLQALKRDPATAGIAIIIISAFTDTLTPDERGAVTAVLQKPFDVHEVIRVIDGVLHSV